MTKMDIAKEQACLDTIVVPAHPDGFQEVFLTQKRWPNVKIDKRRRESIKFVAVYQTKPVSAITHYATIKRFEPLKQAGRYDVVFDGMPTQVKPVKFTDADKCAVQGPRYTSLELIFAATHLARAFPT